MNRLGHGAGSVLRARNRHHMRSADDADTRLETHHTVDRCRTSDRAIGLCSNSAPSKASCYRRAASRRRATRIAVNRVRIAGEPSHSAPSARRISRTDIGPLTQVCFAQDNSACCAHIGDQRRIAAGEVVAQRQTASCCRKLFGFDIVLHQHRAPTQNANVRHLARLEPGGVGIGDDRIEAIFTLIVLLDALDLLTDLFDGIIFAGVFLGIQRNGTKGEQNREQRNM